MLSSFYYSCIYADWGYTIHHHCSKLQPPRAGTWASHARASLPVALTSVAQVPAAYSLLPLSRNSVTVVTLHTSHPIAPLPISDPTWESPSHQLRSPARDPIRLLPRAGFCPGQAAQSVLAPANETRAPFL